MRERKVFVCVLLLAEIPSSNQLPPSVLFSVKRDVARPNHGPLFLLLLLLFDIK